MAIKLGVNIDHAATLRNARGENDPSLIEFAFAVQNAGADSITMHLREDRRHIRDSDVFFIKDQLKIPVNLEMAANAEMLEIALELNPKSICIVPEKREEITTEGGLDLSQKLDTLKPLVQKLLENHIGVFLFIEPDEKTIRLAHECGVTGIEVHTGRYAHSFLNTKKFDLELKQIVKSSELSLDMGLEFHAGHGLNYFNLSPLLEIKNLVEVNIGHSIISRSLFTGISSAVADIKNILQVKL
jgi:pyridoxine 5-phosphate synthase